ncbi:MAG: S-layer homology domain-containing protein [Clostridia bacterium]|nr:S-layer homology domain-containing protein [Clostridia bacterium]
MRARKIWGVLLAVLMLFSSMAVQAAEAPENLLTGNADFEKGLGTDFEGWTATKMGNWELTISKEHARSGAGSLVATISKENAETADVTLAYSDGATKPEVGTEYIMSAWVRTVEPMKHVEGSDRLGVQVYARVNSEASAKYNISEPVGNTDGKWQKIEKTFTVTSAEDTMQYYLRFTSGTYGSIFIDDVQVNRVKDVDMRAPKLEPDKGKMKVENQPPVPATDLKPIPEGNVNIFTNGSFEEVGADGAPAGGWQAYQSKWDNMVQVVDGGIDGNKCIRISDTTGANPWLYKDDFAVVAGMEYQVSVWLRTISVKGSGPRFKIEFYNAAGENFISSQSEMFGKTYGVWHQKSCTFTAPMGAVKCKVYMRMYGAGEIYWDDVQCYAIGTASRVRFDGDTFFYTEWGKGTVGASLNTGAYVPKGTEVFDIALCDGDTVLAERKNVKAIPEAMFTFDVMDMAEIGKKYEVRATLYEAEGKEKMETAVWDVYRYNRPTMINDKGEIVIGGEVITPVWGYHVFSQDENLKLAKAAGVNVIQGGGASLQTGKAYLDLAQANGMYATLILYSGMQAAGTAGKIENTIEMVKGLKDHPALFGYLVMDEPYLHMSDPYPDLVNAYKIIRDIDPVHPVIIQDVIATGSTKFTAATSDLLIIHHYATNMQMISHPSYGMEGTYKVVNKMMGGLENTHVHRKVVHYLGQSFGAATKEEAGNGYYLPTIDEAKSMQYQALIEDMEGIGYYAFQETGWHVKDTPLYEPMCEFAEKEMFLLTDAFIFDKGTFFNEDRTGDVWNHLFSMDGSLYLMLMNMKEEDRTVSVPLESANGKIKIGAFTASLVSGTGKTASVQGDGTFEAAIGPHGALLYKITPSEAVDFSVMEGNFDDMGNHTWAQEAVDYLYEEEIINTKGIRTYAPAQNITRADFAMFLIRALGITGNATEVFADVDPNAEYAKEIAIGKAAGILKGVGDDAYSPDAEITRQDMMVIVQRGLEYAHRQYEKGQGGELDTFSDKALVADYAVEALSAMVKSGIIRGNADGTVNPRGNATRAEAAVVMQRVMN